MHRRPTPHFDLEYLSSLAEGPGELFYLDSQAVAVLSDLADILTWRTRWYDGIEKLSEPPVLAYIIREQLKVPLHLDDLIAAIYETACCVGGFSTQLPESLDPNRDTTLDDSSTEDFGSVTVATVADRLEYKCEACYAMVEAAATTLDNLADFEGWDSPLSPESVGRIIGYIPLVGDFVQPAWLYVVGILDLLWADATGLNDAANAIRAAADTIACAMYQADGADSLAAAMETEVKSALTGYAFATLVADALPYLTYANLVYEGEFIDEDGNTVDLAASLTPGTHDCCVTPATWTQSFETGLEGYGSQSSHDAANELLILVADTSSGAWRGTGGYTGNQIETNYSIPSPATVSRIEIDYELTSGTGSPINSFDWEFQVVEAVTDNTFGPGIIEGDAVTWDTPHTIDYTLPSTVELRATSPGVGFRLRRSQPAADGQRLWVREIRFYA